MNTRRTPLTGIAYVVLFLAAIVASNAPKNSASDHTWVAAYSTHGKQAAHLASGILLALAGLCLMAFLTQLWSAAAARAGSAASPLPVAAAGVAAACVAAGGVVMATAAATALLYSQPLPGADVLRFSNDAGFALAGVAGMLAASLSVVTLSAQARRAGLFGVRLQRFSVVVGIVLLGSIAFVPMLALPIWVLTVAIGLLRGRVGTSAPVRGATPEPSFTG